MDVAVVAFGDEGADDRETWSAVCDDDMPIGRGTVRETWRD